MTDTPESIEKSRQAILTDPQKFRAHMDTMENALKLRVSDEIKHWMEDYDDIVEHSQDPDVRLKHLKMKLDLAGWGPNAKRVENPQDKLPVFHITIGRSTNNAPPPITVIATNADTDEVTDVFDLDDMRPTTQMLSVLGINADVHQEAARA